MFGRLEPRIVLDASAVLNDLGQLVITGTAAADTVKLEVDAVGDLTLYNQDDQIISIAGHPGASETEPLSQNSVTSNQIIVFLAGGDDVFEAQLPSGLDVTLFDGAGLDSVSLTTSSSGPIRESSYTIDAESITLNENVSSEFDLLDDQLLLSGDVHLAIAGDPFELNVNRGDLLVEGRLILGGDVDISATSGRVFLGDATVTADAAAASLSIHLGNQMVSGASIDFGSADDSGGHRLENLSITSTSIITAERGPIEVAGDLNLTSEASTVTLDGLISADKIAIEANGNVSIHGDPLTTTQIQIASGGGDVEVGGSINIDDSIMINAQHGNVDFSGSVITSNSGGDVLTIRDAGDITLASINAANGHLVLGVNQDIVGRIEQAGGSSLIIDRLTVSSDNTIDLSNVDNQIASVESIQSRGDVTLYDSNEGMEVRRIDSGGGNVRIEVRSDLAGVDLADLRLSESIRSQGGNIVLLVDRDIVIDSGAMVDAAAGTIRLESMRDVYLTGLRTLNPSDGAVTVLAESGAIIDSGDTNQDMDADFGGVILTSLSGIGVGNALETSIDRVQATAIQEGSIEISESNSVRLESITTSDGEIRVSAADDIVIADQRDQDLNSAFEVTPIIIALGDNGRIQLDAGNGVDDQLRIGNGVGIIASQSTLGAVQLDAANIVLGEQIEIRTGDDVGVARAFSPRPVIGAIDPAFYDPDSIRTNRLQQANANDGEGVLTVGIGQTGERGLTLNIDWGAETNRYQQVDSIVGGQATSVSHVYTEQDILSSTLNGRSSATAPLEVRFSVRHHESIILTGDTVTQGVLDPNPTIAEQSLPIRAGETESVSSGVVSATDNDNPLRPDLNANFVTNSVSDNSSLTHQNGTARFIIPNLTIPVAFFPVRDVLPQPEEMELVVRNETMLSPKGTSVETSEASASPSSTREEYFQIRVLSPDPFGDDLAEPQRLPDNVLEGDTLKRLFANLPDGRYAIEYILGDGNGRTIIEVDVRDGEPITSGDELDGGYLELKRLEQLPSEDRQEESSVIRSGESGGRDDQR
ncbi:hypothetical protein Q31b_48070 [Novipirellula aureliae]|uniref:Uncharacterized protein n=2 Tax=Novipirellula aureliae TaxID=2527966 RepID=A0A5C6DNJ4_9BACT|nr:hypothetical protein Q31b_48070 [Novipirellula aureliae]